jgi:hypothetical protein
VNRDRITPINIIERPIVSHRDQIRKIHGLFLCSDGKPLLIHWKVEATDKSTQRDHGTPHLALHRSSYMLPVPMLIESQVECTEQQQHQ